MHYSSSYAAQQTGGSLSLSHVPEGVCCLSLYHSTAVSPEPQIECVTTGTPFHHSLASLVRRSLHLIAVWIVARSVPTATATNYCTAMYYPPADARQCNRSGDTGSGAGRAPSYRYTDVWSPYGSMYGDSSAMRPSKVGAFTDSMRQQPGGP